MSQDDNKREIEKLQEKLLQKDQELESFREQILLLNEQVEKLIEKMNQQFRMAIKIQEILLPTELPHIPGFEFSSKFIASGHTGGDFFDIFEIEDRFRFAILLASSSGHGISALFLSVLLKLTGHIEARKGLAPNEVVQLIADEILPNMVTSDYANVFYAMIDRRNFEMSYCNAGNNKVYHFNSSNKELIDLCGGEDPLRSDREPEFQVQSAHLNAGDRLVFVSEGVLEIINNVGEAFGEERLKEMIFNKIEAPLHELRNEVIYQAQQHIGEAELSKDITVIVSEVSDRVLKLAK